TEFYMCAMENRSGNKNSSGGFPIVQTQAERAAAFKAYVETVASKPFVVGAHWFQFSDEPQHGRGDGENYNMGLVDNDGKPYEELTKVCKNLDFSALRSRAAKETAGDITIPSKTIELGQPLKLWPRDRAFVPCSTPAPVSDLYAVWDSDALYLS